MMSMTTSAQTPTVAIRPTTADDAATLERLAQLDSTTIPSGEKLLATIDGTPVAAVAVASGRTIADPFVPTADVVALLQVRAGRLSRTHAPRATRLRRRFALAA